MCSIFATSRGSAASDDEVETISRYSRARYFISEKMLTPVNGAQERAQHEHDEQRSR